MPRTIEAGQTIDLGQITLTPVAPPAPLVTVTQVFACTTPIRINGITGDDTMYVTVKNNSSDSLHVNCYIYDWQDWWGQPEGDDRRWRKGATIAAGASYTFRQAVRHGPGYNKTYFRAEILVGGQIIINIPRFYIEPAKITTKTVEGACTYKEPGMVVLWYSQESECNSWDALYRYPPRQPEWSSPTLRFRTNDTRSYPAVFLPIWDENLKRANLWEACIFGWRAVWFTFTV